MGREGEEGEEVEGGMSREGKTMMDGGTNDGMLFLSVDH